MYHVLSFYHPIGCVVRLFAALTIGMSLQQKDFWELACGGIIYFCCILAETNHLRFIRGSRVFLDTMFEERARDPHQTLHMFLAKYNVTKPRTEEE